MTDPLARIAAHLEDLYGAPSAEDLRARLADRLDRFRAEHPGLAPAEGEALPLTEADAVLITYGDQIREPGIPPLRTLEAVLPPLLGGVVGGLHLLPFYPYSSDDGFSVIDYTAVQPGWGTWADVRRLGRSFRLMFDAVINHLSRESAWFQGFLAGEPPYTGFFVVADPAADLSQVVRPRALPLLTRVETARGPAHVWTTFSDDQIDLNYTNPEVLLAVLDVLLFYVAQGARLLRLDAIAFLWKEVGTSCIHLPETHRLIQLIRAVLDAVAPGVLLISETNVPHAENVSYFGDGTDEAQLVYQFPLPPLVLHTLLAADASALRRWAASLETPSARTTFFNFLSSHDGIGLRPVEGILTDAEIDALVARTAAHGGFVSYRSRPDGTRSPYELNIVYFDALNDPASEEPPAVQVNRFMVAQAILLALAGVPGIYVHSLFGSRNWRDGVAQTGHHRTINRQKFDRARLEAELADPASLRRRVFDRYRALLQARAGTPAFHPNGSQHILDASPALFALVRTAPGGLERVVALHNVTAAPQPFRAALAPYGFSGGAMQDLIDGAAYPLTGARAEVALTLPPYGVRWLHQR